MELPATLLRLNLETRAFHAPSDAGWTALLTPDVTKQQYVDQLVRVFGFEGPLEAALAYTMHLDLFVDVHMRFRAGFIAQDLLELGMSPSVIARLPQCAIAPFASPLEALGWVYVVERASLTHEKVCGHLRAHLREANDACVYLSAGDVRGDGHMHELGHVLERAVRTPAMFDEVVRGAEAGFRTWLDWRELSGELKRLA